MKIIFFGSTNYSNELLKFLLNKNATIQAIFYTLENFEISYSKEKVHNSNFFDLSKTAKKYGLPHFPVDKSTGKTLKSYSSVIQELKPDVILVLGWYYMIPENIRNMAQFGAWGIHASILPKYAGGAPLVWAIINGEQSTGVTLFRMDNGVDDGDIIDQKSFMIEHTDTIKEVYQKATKVSIEILDRVFITKSLPIKFKKQIKSDIEIWPQRKPTDGEIDLSDSGINIYNFIRAQSSPYPGAFIRTIDGKRLIIEKARIEED